MTKWIILDAVLLLLVMLAGLRYNGSIRVITVLGLTVLLACACVLTTSPADAQTMHHPTHTTPPPPAGCNEHSHFGTNMWGFTFAFNECAGEQLVYALTVTGGVSGIVAVMCKPCAWMAGVIAGVLGLFAVGLEHQIIQCGENKYQKWVAIRTPWGMPNWTTVVCSLPY